MKCCSKPNVHNMDYERDGEVVTNRHCLSCGSHEHDGRHYTRAEWDRHFSVGVEPDCSSCGYANGFHHEKCVSGERWTTERDK